MVFGAAWEKGSWRVVHKGLDSVAGLSELRGSKYVTSDFSGVYGPMRKFLSEGRKVLFVGTPCQTAAMRKVLGIDSNLFLCAIFCMANAEGRLWQNYVHQLERRARSPICGVWHRSKKEGRACSFFRVEFEDPSKNFEIPLYDSRWWRLFLDNPRKGCLKCSFRSGACQADLQIGDFWGAEKFYSDLNGTRGLNAVLAFTEKGRNLLSAANLDCRQVPYEQILAGNPYLEQTYVPRPLWRRIASRIKYLLKSLCA